MVRSYVGAVAAAAVLVSSAVAVQGQTPATPATLAQRFAPIDLTGTWVSIVTEDWAVRMIPPPKGDFESLPLTRAAQEAANAADIARLEAAGRACDAYGAPALLRQPGRVRFSWQDASTLKIETDAGQQTRLLHFDGTAAKGAPSLQGFSVAEWQYANGFDPIRADAALAGGGGRAGGGRQGGGPGAGAPPAGGPPAGGGAAAGGGGGRGRFGGAATAPSGGRLKVVTTNLTAGLLRKNGVPYSANAEVTEFFNLLTEPNGTQWVIVTTILHDPANFAVDYITSTNFRKEPDGSKFKPQACSLR